MSRAITGWELPESERDALLQIFAPRYATLVADHVTLRFGTDEDTPLPTARTGEVVGEADDGAGVQALVIRMLAVPRFKAHEIEILAQPNQLSVTGKPADEDVKRAFLRRGIARRAFERRFQRRIYRGRR